MERAEGGGEFEIDPSLESEIKEAGIDGLRQDMRAKLLEWDALWVHAPAEFPDKAALGMLGVAMGRLLRAEVYGNHADRLKSALQAISDATGILKKELDRIEPPDDDS